MTAVIIFVYYFIYFFVMVRKMGPHQGNILAMPLISSHSSHSFHFISLVMVQQAWSTSTLVDPGGPVVIILATGSEVCGFKPGQGRWIFS